MVQNQDQFQDRNLVHGQRARVAVEARAMLKTKVGQTHQTCRSMTKVVQCLNRNQGAGVRLDQSLRHDQDLRVHQNLAPDQGPKVLRNLARNLKVLRNLALDQDQGQEAQHTKSAKLF